MPKSKQSITKTEKQLLKYIFLFQPVNKALLRLIGANYDFTGRVISSLITKGLVENITIKATHEKKENALQLSDSGYRLILPYITISDTLLYKNKNRIKGDDNKYRQYKLSSVISMFGPLFGDYTEQFLDMEHRLEYKLFPIEQEIEKRKKEHPNGFILTNREIRDMDEYNLRKVTATRSNGIAISNDSCYLLYNHNHKRMRSHGDFENKFKTYMEMTLPNNKISSIHFGRSYKPAIDTLFKTSISQRETFIMSQSCHENTFFVPLTHNGAQQLKLYFIPKVKEQIAGILLEKKEMDRAHNTPYDGEAENGDIIFLGFECDIQNIERIIYILNTIKAESEVTVFCFSHQQEFYKQVFKNRATILPLAPAELFKEIN